MEGQKQEFRQMKGATTMTMIEKLRIHQEIEEANRRHEQEWREAISQADEEKEVIA